MERKVVSFSPGLPININSRLKTFLKMEKANSLTLETVEPDVIVHVVIGNTTCDLDSAASTVGLAHLIYSEMDNEDDYVLPLFNIRPRDLPLKTELVHYMTKYGVTAGDLIYSDDVMESLLRVGKMGQLRVNLVDHHVTTPELKEYVVCVYDHRPMEYDWPPPVEFTLLPVGSCSTLILKRILGSYNVGPNCMQYPEALEMMYGAILLDTNNMSMQTMRYTPIDMEMATKFERLPFWEAKAVSRNDYYNELLAACSNVANLTPLQLLYKDMKAAVGCPISVLTTLVQDYCTLDGAEKALEDFSIAEKTNVVVLMGIVHVNGKVMRDLGFYSNSEGEETIEKIIEKLTECDNPRYCLERVDLPCEISGLLLFQQGNLSITRKITLPLIQQVMRCHPGV